MSYKKYCFIPEQVKVIDVFNSLNPALDAYCKSSENLRFLDHVQGDVQFKICLEQSDKAKTFYIDGDNNVSGMSDYDYFRYKSLTAIKSLYSGNEIMSFNLYCDDTPRLEFTVVYDAEGMPVSKAALSKENQYKTLVAHTYTFNFYKRYEN